jgi:hypothetical protein
MEGGEEGKSSAEDLLMNRFKLGNRQLVASDIYDQPRSLSARKERGGRYIQNNVEQ